MERKYIQNLYKSYMFPPDKIPLIFSNTILAGYFFGESGLAVVSLLMPIYFLFETLGYWINYGGLIKTLEEISENQPLRARSYSKLSLTLSIVVGIITAALVLIFFDNLLEILAVPESLKLLAQDYGKFLVVAGFLLLLCSYAWQFVKIIGLQKRVKQIYVPIMLVDVVGCFIAEKIFALGIISLVVGMILAEIFILAFIGVQLKKNLGRNLFAEIKEPLNSTWNLIYAGSSPSAGKFYGLFQVYLFNIFFLRFFGETGVAVFALLQVAIRICCLHSQVTWQPLPPLFAVEFGDKNISSMFLIFKTALIRAVIFNGLPAVVIFFGADFFAAQSGLNPTNYDFAAKALSIYSLSVVLAAINSIFITLYLSTDHKILSNAAEFMRSIVAIIIFLKFAAHEYVFWSFLFAEVVATVILFVGTIFIKKFGDFKTILLLGGEFFKPSLFFVVDRKIGFTSEQSERLKTFLAPNTLKFLSDWLNLLKKFSDTGKNDFLAVHIFREDDRLRLTLRGTGNLFKYSTNPDAISLIKSCNDIEKYKFNSLLGMNNLYLQIFDNAPLNISTTNDVAFKISKRFFSESISRLEKSLTELKLNRQEIMSAKLLTEEIFLRLKSVSAEPEDFSAQINIKKRFGNINIVISSKEEPFNPLKNLSDAKEDDDDYFNIQILKVNLDKIKYSRANGKNIVSIKIHESDSKTLQNTFIGLIFGTFIGLFLRTFADSDVNLWIVENIIDSLQTIFINALTMVVAPMIFFSIIDGIISISDASYIGRIGWRLILFSLLKLAFYVALGLFAGFIVGGMPELLPMLQDNSVLNENTVSIRNLIVNIIPDDVITPFNTNNILQLIFLACFFGVMLNRAGEYAAWAKDGVKFLSRFTVDVIGVLSLVIPFLVCVSMAKLMINVGISGLVAYLGLILTSALGLPICFLISAALITLICKILPTPFIKKAAKFSILPFSLSSSNACLPATLSFCSEKLGMDEKLTKFAIPVGMQFNMDGTAYYVAVVSMMLAKTFGINMDADFLLSFFLIEFFMALTGIGLIIMPPMLSGLGIPPTAVAHFIGIEPILDMFGTAQSVVGNITSAFIITHLENKVDDKIYRAHK